MNTTISMNSVLNIIHSMALSTSNKKWLADHLYKEVEAESKATNVVSVDGWPKLKPEDLNISADIIKLVEDIDPLPQDFDYKEARLDYLLKKHS